jgi:hypothetical protein
MPSRCSPMPTAFITTRRGNGVLYRGTEFVEALTERDGAATYFVTAEDGRAVETRLDTTRI